MNLKLLKLTLFSTSTFLFSIWWLVVHINWSTLQNIRQFDILWLVNSIYPWLYFIILGYIFILVISLYYRVDNRLFHILYVVQLVLILHATPYFVSDYYRFPDTYNVVQQSSIFYESVLEKNPYNYVNSYPLLYIFTYMVDCISGIDLMYFSRIIFSPGVLLSIFVIWYLFVEKIFNSRAAFISTIVAIPSQVIEISVTPNSFSIVLVLVSLLLCTHNKFYSRILFFVTVPAVIFSHPINAIILVTFILILYVFEMVFKIKQFYISSATLGFILVSWLGWTLLHASMGTGIVRTVYNMIIMNTESLEIISTYTLGSGNLIYPWIQKMNMYKYILYAIMVITFIAVDFRFSIKNVFLKIHNINLKKYIFLVLSLVLLSFTLITLIYGGGDSQNIISRSLNYSMLCISIFIGVSFVSLRCAKKELYKCLRIMFIIFLLVIYISYPTYSYARDSYINFPASQKYGDKFLSYYVDESPVVTCKYSKNLYFFQKMNDLHTISCGSHTDSKFYDNGWIYLFNNLKKDYHV